MCRCVHTYPHTHICIQCYTIYHPYRSSITIVKILNSSNTKSIPYVTLLSPYPPPSCHLPNFSSLMTTNLVSIYKVSSFKKMLDKCNYKQCNLFGIGYFHLVQIPGESFVLLQHHSSLFLIITE